MAISLFKKSSNANTMVATMRARRDDLAAQLAAVHQEIPGLKDRVRNFLIEGGDPALLAKAKTALAAADADAVDLADAIAVLDAQIAEKVSELAAVADRKRRETTVAELEAHAKRINEAALAFIAGARAYAEATGKIAGDVIDVRETHALATHLATIIPDAAALVGRVIRDHAAAVLAGSAPSTLKSGAPVVSAPQPTPVRTRPLLALADIAWPNGTAAKHDQCVLPVEWADVAVRTGHALEMSDGRCKGFYSGGKAAPMRSNCIDLADPNLRSLKQAFGEDILKQRANMVEQNGGKVTRFAQKGI